MKKFFTSISLAAALFMAAAPVSAQEQQLTDSQKKEAIEEIVPALFEQVKQVSGIDIEALAHPSIEQVINAPLFGTTSLLRAASADKVTIQPDSVKMTISKLKTDLKVVFADYRTFDLTTLTGAPTELSFPKTISTAFMNMPITVNIEMGERNGLLPFSTLALKLNLGAVSSLVGIEPNATLVSMKETASEGKYTYDITLTKDARTLLALVSKETAAKLTDYKITADMTKIAAGEVSASLYYVSGTVQIPGGDAVVTLDKLSLAQGKQVVDNIVLTSYKEGTTAVEDYTKLVMKKPEVSEDGKTVTNVTEVYEAKTIPADGNWGTLKETVTRTLKGKYAIDTEKLVASIVGGILADMKAGGREEAFTFTLTEKENEATATEKTPLELTVIPSMEGTQAAIATVAIVSDKGEKDASRTDLKVRIPLASETISVEVYPNVTLTNGLADEVKTPVATLYIKSNLLTYNPTANEAITPEAKAKVLVAENGLYINNVSDATYSIVSITGKVVANGIISGDNAYVATPSLQRGQIYILSIVEKGAQQVVKFRK